MNSGNQVAVSPPIAMLFVVGLFVWMLFRPKSTAPVKIFLFIAATLAFGPLSIRVMDWENAAFPLKFDNHLFLIDRAIGVSAFSVARYLSTEMRSFLFVVYETLGYWMIAWYGLNLALKRGRPNHTAIAFAVAYALAPVFYLAVPACGPRHAFGDVFPIGNPEVGAVLTPLHYWPNAIPSLHMATAILLVYFSAGSRAMRAFAWTYLAGTVLATLAFEHYLIDLVVAVPYALFVIAIVEGRWRGAARKLGVVAGWLITIRFATPLLVQIPLAVPMLCLATVALALFSRGAASDPAGRSVETAEGSRTPVLSESFDRLPAR
jgi:hypothetical protein